jgi:hypothetical protein
MDHHLARNLDCSRWIVQMLAGPLSSKQNDWTIVLNYVANDNILVPYDPKDKLYRLTHAGLLSARAGTTRGLQSVLGNKRYETSRKTLYRCT